MLQSTSCVFPQVAFFLELKDLCRLSATSQDIIPEAWESDVWHVVANGACSGFRRAYHLSNLDRHTIAEIMKHVVCVTPVFDSNAIVVDSKPLANKMVQLARDMVSETSIVDSASDMSPTTFLTRFQFDEDCVEEHSMDPAEIAYSLPSVFDLAGDQCFLEMSLHNNGLKLSLHNYSQSVLCNDDEEDEDAEPIALSKPLRIRICSISPDIVLSHEFVLSYVDVDVPGYGIWKEQSSPELTTQALVEGFACMVSVSELSWGELDVLRLEGRCCC
jgi:hypothetical protein